MSVKIHSPIYYVALNLVIVVIVVLSSIYLYGKVKNNVSIEIAKNPSTGKEDVSKVIASAIFKLAGLLAAFLLIIFVIYRSMHSNTHAV